LGTDIALKWRQNNGGLLVDLPDEKPGEHAWVLKIQT
jgi:hypothetical protein